MENDAKAMMNTAQFQRKPYINYIYWLIIGCGGGWGSEAYPRHSSCLLAWLKNVVYFVLR
jgi:hypothetical protein